MTKLFFVIYSSMNFTRQKVAWVKKNFFFRELILPEDENENSFACVRQQMWRRF
jgi:hypothetical protein